MSLDPTQQNTSTSSAPGAFNPKTFMLSGGTSPHRLNNLDSARTAAASSSSIRMNAFKANGNTWNPKTFMLQGGTQQTTANASDPTKINTTDIASRAQAVGGAIGGAVKGFYNGVKQLGKSALDAFTKPGQAPQGTIQGDVQSDVDKGFSPLHTTVDAVGDTIGDAANILGAGDVVANKDAILDFAKGVGSSVEGKLGQFISDTTKFVQKGTMGKNALEVLDKLNNPETRAFIPSAEGGAGKTFDAVVKNVTDAVGKFTTDSKAALQKVKDALPDVSIKPSEIATRVNQGIMNAVENNAAYKGVAKDASMFKSPEDLINSGLLDDNEAKKVKGMIDVVKNWGDNSARGILNLKEKLSAFYKDGLGNSNAILRNIQGGLKDLVSEAAPDSGIKTALKTASDNIDKGEDFVRQLIGKDPEFQGESKLSSIAKNLKNPAAGGGKLNLLQDLKNATGYDVLPELKGYTDFKSLLSDGGKLPSRTGTVLTGIAKQMFKGGLGVEAAKGIKDLYDYL